MRERIGLGSLVLLTVGTVIGAVQWWSTGSLTTGLLEGLSAGAVFTVGLFIGSIALQRFSVFGIKTVDGWDAGEVVIRSGAANMMKRGYALGGKLYLTNKRLRFCPHRINIETSDYSFPVSHVNSIEPSRAMGVVPNAITISLHDGRAIKFVVYDRMKWVSTISERVGPPRQPHVV
jgi:hypothetical protein